MRPRARAILPYLLRPYAWLLGGILLASLLGSFLEGLNLAAFFPLFASLLGSGQGPAPVGFLGVLSSMTQSLPFQDPLFSALILLIGVTLLKNGALLIREGLVATASGRIQHDLRNRLMECYARAPYLSVLDKKQGRLIYQTSVGATRVGILIHKVAQWFAELLKIVAIAFLLIVTLPLAAGVLGMVAIGYLGLTRFLSRRISYLTGKGRMTASAEQTSIVNEFLNGIRQILLFGTHRAWLEKFRLQSRIFRDLYVKDAFWLSVPKALMELSFIGLICGFVLAFRAVDPSALTGNLSALGVFAMATLKLLPSFSSVGQLRMELSGLMADAEEVHRALTEMKPGPFEPGRSFPALQKAIEFDSVHFAYPGREELFKGIGVYFEKGKVTGIVGPSGSGKTTLVNLILGLFPPTEGRILIDGVNLNEYRLESWRCHIGFVAQDPFIFHASVRENITFGREGHSWEAIRKAARIAHADEFIGKLPQGYETLVGERGMKLSTGQQQRLCIARAMLDEPEILILDEATSALDTESESLIQDAIEKISSGRTVILIAHRLSTVRHADKIVVLEQGRIIEEGSHRELLDGRGRYFQLVASPT